MSSCEFESLEKSLESYLPEAELAEVKRILFGKETKWVEVLFSPHYWFSVLWIRTAKPCFILLFSSPFVPGKLLYSWVDFDQQSKSSSRLSPQTQSPVQKFQPS